MGERYEEGLTLLQFSVEVCWDQISRGKFFLHEHPATASSWDLPIIRELAEHPGVTIVTGDMCRWDATPLFVGPMLLRRTQAADQVFGGPCRPQRGVQTVCRGQDDHGRRLLLQDGVGHDPAKAQAHIAGPGHQRSVDQARHAGRGVQSTTASSSLSFIQTDGARLQRQEHHVLLGTQSPPSVLQRRIHRPRPALGDHGARCSTWETSVGQQSARLHRNTFPAMSAYRTWLQHGREDVPVALFENPDNICYCNATIASLLVCHHHHHRHLLHRGLRPQWEHDDYWGCIGKVAAAAVSNWTSLWHVPAFLLALKNWDDIHRQHDSAEFLDHISVSIPCLVRPYPRRRISSPDGIEEQDAHLGLHVLRDGENLACCVRRWDG